MLNRSGISTETLTAPRQILANVEMQVSVGCIVPQAVGVTVGAKKIAKAGTPINVDLVNRNTVAKKPADAIPMNAVLLHDVDVTTGSANGTALIFGFVNLARLDTDTQALVTAAQAITGSTQQITFMK